MLNASDVSLVIGAGNENLGNLVRTALKGAGVREVRVATNPQDLMAACAQMTPDAMIAVVENPEVSDIGFKMIRFVRRYEKCPNRYIPIVAVSPRRDAATVRAVINSGGHEYAALPASGELIFRKVVNSIFVGWAFIDHPSYVGPCRRRRVSPDFKGPERRANWTAPDAARGAREEMANSLIETPPAA